MAALIRGRDVYMLAKLGILPSPWGTKKRHLETLWKHFERTSEALLSSVWEHFGSAFELSLGSPYFSV